MRVTSGGGVETAAAGGANTAEPANAPAPMKVLLWMLDFITMSAQEHTTDGFSMRQSATLVLICYLFSALLGILLSHGLDHRSFFDTATSKGDNQEFLDLT